MFKSKTITTSINALKDIKNLRKKYIYLYEVDGFAISNSIKELYYAISKYNNRKSNFPKKRVNRLYGKYKTTNLVDNEMISINIKKRIIKLPKLGELEYKGYKKMVSFDKKILEARVIRDANKYYVNLIVKEDIKEEIFILKNMVGIDLGAKYVLVTSDGKVYNKINVTKEEKIINRLKQKLEKCVYQSNNYKKIIERINRQYRKIRNKRRVESHKITGELVNKYDLICLENLDVGNIIKNGKYRKLSKKISNNVLALINEQLIYKSKWKNKKLSRVGKYYPSSQLCSKCGYKNSKMKDLNERVFICEKCNNRLDRDINASVNILNEGLDLFIKDLLKQLKK